MHIELTYLAMRDPATGEVVTTVVKESSNHASLYLRLKDGTEASFEGDAWYFEGWAAGAYRKDKPGVPYEVEIMYKTVTMEIADEFAKAGA